MQPHVIHSMKVSLRVPDIESAFPMQQRVKECLGKEWDEQLTAILDKYSTGDQFLQIPRLEIHLESLPVHQWEKHFKERFMEALDQALSAYSSDTAAQAQVHAASDGFQEEDRPWGPCSASEQYQDTWLFFMQYGMLPWWAQAETATALEEKVIAAVKAQPEFCKEQWTRARMKGNLSVQRWVQQCSPALQRAVIEALAGEALTGTVMGWEATMLLGFSTKNSVVHLRDLQFLYWDVIFHLLLNEEQETIQGTAIIPLLKKHWAKWISTAMSTVEMEILEVMVFKTTQETTSSMSPEVAVTADTTPAIATRENTSASITSPERTSTNTPSDKINKHASPDLGIGEHLLINDAGLVLLHPFLLHLFKHFEWLEENDTRLSPLYVHRAVHLLAFIVSGEEQMPEYNLVFPKLLCGLPLDTPLEKDLHLTVEEKEQAHELLGVVIKYWDALGSTSADGLRSTFLQREGKLIFEEDQWLLIVTTQTVDILLNRLPWGFGFVKLPWMEQLLKVQWNP